MMAQFPENVTFNASRKREFFHDLRVSHENRSVHQQRPMAFLAWTRVSDRWHRQVDQEQRRQLTASLAHPKHHLEQVGIDKIHSLCFSHIKILFKFQNFRKIWKSTIEWLSNPQQEVALELCGTSANRNLHQVFGAVLSSRKLLAKTMEVSEVSGKESSNFWIKVALMTVQFYQILQMRTKSRNFRAESQGCLVTDRPQVAFVTRRFARISLVEFDNWQFCVN